jgi:Fe-S cluster assembly ATP-binding protein
MIDGRIVETGGKELALELEAKGYAGHSQAGAATQSAALTGV